MVAVRLLRGAQVGAVADLLDSYWRSRKIPDKLSSRVDGEDVLHEAFLRAFHSIELFDSPREDGFYALDHRAR